MHATNCLNCSLSSRVGYRSITSLGSYSTDGRMSTLSAFIMGREQFSTVFRIISYSLSALSVLKLVGALFTTSAILSALIDLKASSMTPQSSYSFIEIRELGGIISTTNDMSKPANCSLYLLIQSGIGILGSERPGVSMISTFGTVDFNVLNPFVTPPS